MIELALPSSRGFDDLIGAGSASSLLVKYIRCGPHDSEPGVGTSDETVFINTFHLYP